ncbi:interferon-inducible GTPase 5-like [Branchiostoma lanceolatum]|uniref:interferon-inducible GTPase 5-like n=1 Tax=Branchiostoma lanceolatum TaxID=7740 RepID=UPI003455757E
MATNSNQQTPTDGNDCPLEVDQLTISEKHLSQDELDELERIRDDGTTDFEKVAHRMTLKIQESEHATVNIGIVGEAGAGKSTFINSFRGIKPGEEGAAEVSAFRHTTNDVTRYPVPDNQNIVLVDFPGVIFRNTGTRTDVVEEFNTKSYLNLYGAEMEECDVFLVFVTCRVSNNIIWIANEVRKMKKNVLFVRSKIDVDLANESRDNPRRFPKGTSANTIEVRRFLEELRKVTTKELERLSYTEVKETTVFVICGLSDDVASGTFDMTNLRKAIYNTLTVDKKGVLINGLVEFATDMVHDKAEYLRSREVIVAAVANTVISATPIPGLGLALDIGILVGGYHRFKRALCLDKKSLRQLAAVGNKDYESLKKFVNRRLVLSEKIEAASGPLAIRAIIGGAATGVTLGAIACTTLAMRVSLPLVGGILAAPASAALVVYIMRKMINEMERCAIELHEYAFGEEPSPANIGILGKECSSRREFLNAIRGIRSSDLKPSIPEKSSKKPKEHESSDNLVFVEFPSPQIKKSFFRDTLDEDGYRKSFGDDLKLCDVCLVFIDKEMTAETVAVAKIAKERTKVLFVRVNEFHPSANQSGTSVISAFRKQLEKVKFGDVDMSDVFIISTEYDAVTQDIGETPALRRAIFKELQDADKTDRNVMYMSLDTLMLNDDDAGSITKGLAEGLRAIEMFGQNQSDDVSDLIKSKEDCLPKWEQTTIRIG